MRALRLQQRTPLAQNQRVRARRRAARQREVAVGGEGSERGEEIGGERREGLGEFVDEVLRQRELDEGRV